MSGAESAAGVYLATTRDGAVAFEVRATPRARTSGLAGVRDGALLVRLAAPPVDGAANAELVETLAAALGVAKRDISVVRGASARRKRIELRGLEASEVARRLERNVG
jgi:hypothetical protein